MRRHPQFFSYLALASVCVFWGTTYLGIRMALETFPPAMLVSFRYILSGGILLGGSLIARSYVPSGRELLWTAVFGVIIIGLGNGALAFAELIIPSGLAALFITTSPFWMVGMEALVPGGDRLHGPTIAGMLVGLSGTLLLVAPSALHSGLSGPVLKGFLMLQLGCCGWAIGSILQRRHTTKAHPVVSGAVQQLATGLVYLVPALALKSEPVHWNARGVGAMLYLVTFGSIVGYSAYLYALNSLPVSVVSIYNYVNPIIALLLGWLFYREHVGWREFVAMAVIFAGVTLVKRYGSGASAQQHRPSAEVADSADAEPRHTAA